jgi:hypothetical protein
MCGHSDALPESESEMERAALYRKEGQGIKKIIF